MQRMSLARLGSKQHFIRTLESQGLLDRQIEYLPSDAEIADRKSRGIGLTRPELAVLLSYSKLVAYQRSEEHTSELQSLMRTSYAVFCLKKKSIMELSI